MENTLCFLVLSVILSSSMVKSFETFSESLPPKTLGLKQEKLTHLHFYFHDRVRGEKQNTIPITNPPINSSTAFGTLFMADDPLTVGPDPDSKQVGSAQGLFGGASQTEVGFLMVFNFVFTEGKYNGSTLSLLGHNAVLSGVREMSIVGGSKVFRFARGYALAKTYSVDPATRNFIVEYDVYVLHY